MYFQRNGQYLKQQGGGISVSVRTTWKVNPHESEYEASVKLNTLNLLIQYVRGSDFIFMRVRGLGISFCLRALVGPFPSALVGPFPGALVGPFPGALVGPWALVGSSFGPLWALPLGPCGPLLWALVGPFPWTVAGPSRPADPRGCRG